MSKVSKGKIKKVGKEEKKDKVNKRDQYQIISLKDAYIFNQINGEYWLGMYNMLVDQLEGNVDAGLVDGVQKTKQVLFAEASLHKLRAYKSYRQAYFNTEELKKLGCSAEDLNSYVRDFQDNKAKRAEYDKKMNIDSKPGFVNV